MTLEKEKGLPQCPAPGAGSRLCQTESEYSSLDAVEAAVRVLEDNLVQCR